MLNSPFFNQNSTENQNKVLADVTIGELQKANSRLKPNKTPGSDGFTVEWYKTYNDTLFPLLLRTFNWVLRNQDYKLFTSILAKHLEAILSDIIQLDQTGFITCVQTETGKSSKNA